MSKVNKSEIVYPKGTLPKKNYLMMVLLSLEFLLLFPIFKYIVKKSLKNSKNIDFSPGFYFYFGYNIYAEDCFLGDTYIADWAPVYIGKNTNFSNQNMILTGTHSLEDFNTVIVKPVIIGNNVWVTSRCVILCGVTIGDNSVISAGSVVTEDVPSNVVVAGNPAKIIRYLPKK